MQNQFLKVFFTLGIAFKILMSFGQVKAPLCNQFPDKSQGYFVFAKERFPTVTAWVLRVQQEVQNGTLKEWRDIQTIRTTENFYRLPQIFMLPDEPTRVVINGFTNSGVNVGEEIWTAPPFQPELRKIGKVRCVGRTYIWELHGYDVLDSFGNSTGEGKFQFTRGDEVNGSGTTLAGVRGLRASQGIAHLQQFNGMPPSNIMSPRHHGRPTWDSQDYSLRSDQLYFQVFNLTGNDNIRDDNGHLVIGNAWVVKKVRGFWEEIGSDWFTTAHDASHYFSQWGTAPGTAWYELINQKLGIDCNCLPIPSNGNSSGGVNSGSNWKEWFDKLQASVVRKWEKPNSPLFPLLEEFHNELVNEQSYNHDNDIPWWPANEVSHIMVFPLSVDGSTNSENPIIQISKNQVINEDGSINNYSFGLEPGLYTAKMFVSDYGFIDLYFEVDEYAVQSYPISSYLNVEIFPVPFTDNQTLTVKASSNFTMNYTYYLHGENGRQLDKQVVRSKAQEEVNFIYDTNNLPSGLLFHKFVFEDGSEVIYQSTKM